MENIDEEMRGLSNSRLVDMVSHLFTYKPPVQKVLLKEITSRLAFINEWEKSHPVLAIAVAEEENP